METFKNRFLFNCNYFLLWIVYFVVARLFFLLFYFKKTEELGLLTTLKTFIYGLRLDISFASYLCFIPFVLIIFSVFTRSKKIESILKWYSIILIIVLSLLLMIDASLYQSWGTRLDTAFLKYLNTPKLMIASVTNFQLISGERRLRASKLAGLEEIPAYIRIADDQEMLEMALVENIIGSPARDSGKTAHVLAR